MATQQTHTENPFTHEGATYNDKGKGHNPSPLETKEVVKVSINLEDILIRLNEITGRDNMLELLSDQQKQAIIDNIGDEFQQYLIDYVDNWLGQTDIVSHVYDCFTQDDCEPTKDYPFTPVD